MKKTIAITIMLAIIMSVATCVFAAEGDVTANVTSVKEVNVGDEITVTVTLTPKVQATDFILSYGKEGLVEFVDAKNVTNKDNDAAKGEVRTGFFTPIVGTEKVEYTFRAKKAGTVKFTVIPGSNGASNMSDEDVAVVAGTVGTTVIKEKEPEIKPGGDDQEKPGGDNQGTTGGNNQGTTGGNNQGATGGDNQGTTGGDNQGTTSGDDQGTTSTTTTPTETISGSKQEASVTGDTAKGPMPQTGINVVEVATVAVAVVAIAVIGSAVVIKKRLTK